jgi:predicted transcriptional regulator
MSVNLPTNWKPEKARAIDILVTNPSCKIQEISQEIGVSKNTIRNWMKEPEFVEIYYQKYMITFGAKLPTVLQSMIREAEAGNVQAGRLVLEHSGKLIKRVEVANNQSPFEKFLNNQASDMQEIDTIDAEVEEIEPEFKVLPERPIVPPKNASKAQQLRELKKKEEKNRKRREARHWRERAEAVGVDKPERGRQTKAQRKMWQDKVVAREKALNVTPYTEK